MTVEYKRYEGVIVPLITPMTRDFEVDVPALRRLLEFCAESGIRAFLLAGTTGEAISLSEAKKELLFREARRHLGAAYMLYGGIGGNCLEAVIDRGKRYQELGMDAIVAHTPHYYPLNQDEIYHWYIRLADGIGGPLLLYNIPQTSHHSLDLEIIERLSHHPSLVGIKDSEFLPERLEQLITRYRDRNDFDVYIGPTVFAARTMELGANGFVPSLGNVLPGTMQQIFEAARDGNHMRAQELQAEATGLNDVYLKGKPIGNAIADLKYMLHLMGICGPTVAPPLVDTPGDRAENLKQKAVEFNLV